MALQCGVLPWHSSKLSRLAFVKLKIKLSYPSSPSLSTSSVQYLRKKPKQESTFLGISKWFWMKMKPGEIARELVHAWLRRKYTKERFSTMAEKERQNLFHRITILYALTTWTAVGVAFYITVSGSLKTTKKNTNPLPHEEEIERGGALWWTTTLKSTDQLQDAKEIKVFRFRGASYEGSEDIALKAKEVGQAMRAQITGGSETGSGCDDAFLRKFNNIEQERHGGPTNQQLREQLAAEGKDYELMLSYANSVYGIKTRYNEDGTVGKFIREEEDLHSTIEDFRKKSGGSKDTQKDGKWEDGEVGDAELIS